MRGLICRNFFAVGRSFGDCGGFGWGTDNQKLSVEND